MPTSEKNSSALKPSAMCSIGNDIVDLLEEEPNLHPRWRNRVFTPDELDRIGERRPLLWSYWAAKEAAYKTLKRSMPSLVFAPRRFQCNHHTGLVHYDHLTLPIAVSVTADYVSVLCVYEPAGHPTLERCYLWIAECAELSRRSGAALSPSEAVRQLATVECGTVLRLSPEDLSVGFLTKGSKVPCVLHRGAMLPHLLSFSHHGRFVSCALLLHA